MINTVSIDFDEFVNVFNKKGKTEAKLLARERYNLSFVQVKRRMTNFTDYFFDLSLRTYRHKKQEDILDAKFMSIDELDNCNIKENVVKGIEPLSGPNSNSEFDELVKELIKDRIIILNK